MAGINDLLKVLTPVKPGDDVAEAAASSRMNAIQDLLRALVKGDNIISGENVRKQSQEGWVILSAQPKGAGSVGNDNTFSFQLSIDSVNNGVTKSVRVLVIDGEINDEFPSGMTGADDYFITLTVEGTEIYAVVTYALDTLAITSRSIAFASTVPDNTIVGNVGTVYIPLGYVDWEFAPITGDIINVVPHNRQVGDIRLSFVYGELNGAAAIYFLRQYSDPIAVPP